MNHPFLINAVVAIVSAGLAYGFRGWIHKEEVAVSEAIRAEFYKIEGELRDALVKGETGLREDVKNVLSRISGWF